MRTEGVSSLHDIEAIVFEFDAKLTIITKNNKQNPDTISETLLPLTD